MSKLKRRTSLTGALVLGLACMSPATHATLTINSVVGGVPSGASSYVKFNDLLLGNAGGTSDGIAVSFTGAGQTVQGSSPGFYAAPVLSNNNGANFGGQPDGTDTTHYLTTGQDQVILGLPSAEKYFGLLWGSVDAYNTLEFFSGMTSVGTITGTDVSASANGDQGANGTYYVNINSDVSFDRVVASSSGYAFEFDNVAYHTEALTVPEPVSMALFSVGLIGVGFTRCKAAA